MKSNIWEIVGGSDPTYTNLVQLTKTKK